MKNFIITSLILLTIRSTSGQIPEIDYFGQIPPVDSAIVFAPDIISLSNRYNQNGSFSPDGNEFCFTVTNRGWTNCDIYYTKIESDDWLTPQIADFVSGDIWDPFFTPDGINIIYSSSGDLWMLENLTDGWGSPKKLGLPVSSSSPEFSPSASMYGTIYFFSRRSTDIYRAIKEDGLYNEVEKLQSPINDFDDREPFIAPNESYILFSSKNRPDCKGSGDLYISYNQNDSWSDPKNLGSKINSIHDEFSPNVTSDGKYLIFTRRTNSESMIYWVSTSFIQELRPSEISITSKANTEFSIFPNPATHTIQIKTDGILSDIAGYSIFDLSGNLIKQGESESEMLDVSGLNKGVYIFSLQTDKQQISKKIVIE